MKPIKFHSVFADSMEQFVAFKKAGNAAYQHGTKCLIKFDQFASKQHLQEPVLTEDIAKQYRSSIAYLTPPTQYSLMCVVRQFSAFHHLRFPSSEVLLELGIKRQSSSRFIVLTTNEVAELMRATDTPNPIRPWADAMKCLIGLLYCSALRIREALDLNIEDFDVNHATLFVRCGKFRKQRYVPLAESSCAAISEHLTSRLLPSRVQAQTPLFVDQHQRRLTYHKVYRAFKALLDTTELRNRRGPLRLHDLRHSFASNQMRKIVQENQDVYSVLPKLATFMGHVSFSSTQIYLHTDPAALTHASERFHNAFYNSTQA